MTVGLWVQRNVLRSFICFTLILSKLRKTAPPPFAPTRRGFETVPSRKVNFRTPPKAPSWSVRTFHFQKQQSATSLYSFKKVSKNKHVSTMFWSRNGVIRWWFETFGFRFVFGSWASTKLLESTRVVPLESSDPFISELSIKLFFHLINLKLLTPLTMSL